MPDIDEMLRDYAGRWRAGLGEMPVHETTRPRHWPALLAAAAVLAVVAVAALVTATQDQALPPVPAHHPTQHPEPPGRTDLVPWLPLRPTHPTLPVRRFPGRPLPGAAADLPACRQDQVRKRVLGDGATGALMVGVELHLVGDRPCRLAGGYPIIEPIFRGPAVHLPLQREHQRGHWPASAPVPVTRHDPAIVLVWWRYSAYCGPHFDMPSLRVTVPGLAPMTVNGFGRSQCLNGPTHEVPPLQVWPLAPQAYQPARTDSLWHGVRARGDLHLTARPGKTVHFTITLVSPRDLVLDPCPDYQMLLAGTGIAPRQPSYALNCAAVPYHDSAGTPMLPAHTPVTFAMQVRAPQQSATKFIWSLGPEMLGVDDFGRLTVAPTGTLHAPTCKAGALRPTANMGGAGGTAYLRIDLHLRGSQPCRLDGYPDVQPMSHGKDMPIEVRQEPRTTWGWTGGSFLVRPGQPAVEQIAWPVGHFCGQLDNDHLRLSLPSGGTPLIVRGFGTTMCNPGEGQPPMVVSPLAPWTSLIHGTQQPS